MEWKEKVGGFKKIDVRGIAGNFLEGLKNQAAKLPVGEGLRPGAKSPRCSSA